LTSVTSVNGCVCPSGFEYRAGSCNKCTSASGRWKANIGNNDPCIPCAINTYWSSSSSCATCPTYSESPQQSSTIEACICLPGYYQLDGSCAPCDEGEFSLRGADDVAQCRTCPSDAVEGYGGSGSCTRNDTLTTIQPLAINSIKTIQTLIPTADARISLLTAATSINFGTDTELRVQSSIWATVLLFDLSSLTPANFSQAILRLYMTQSPQNAKGHVPVPLRIQASTSNVAFTDSDVSGTYPTIQTWRSLPIARQLNIEQLPSTFEDDGGEYALEFDVSSEVRRRLAATGSNGLMTLRITAISDTTQTVQSFTSKEAAGQTPPTLTIYTEDCVALPDADSTIRSTWNDFSWADDASMTVSNIYKGAYKDAIALRFPLGLIPLNSVWVQLRMIRVNDANTDTLGVYRVTNTTILSGFEEYAISALNVPMVPSTNEHVTAIPNDVTEFAEVWWNVSSMVAAAQSENAASIVMYIAPTTNSSTTTAFASKEWLDMGYRPRLIACSCKGKATQCNYDIYNGISCVGCDSHTAGAHCEQCSAGYELQASTCIPCSAGKYQPSVGTSCTPCWNNSYSTPGASTCTCNIGYEATSPGVCADTNECLSSTTNDCVAPSVCINTPAYYQCSPYVVINSLVPAPPPPGYPLLNVDFGQKRLIANSTKGGQRISMVIFNGTHASLPNSPLTIVYGSNSNRGKYECTSPVMTSITWNTTQVSCVISPGVGGKLLFGVKFCYQDISGVLCPIIGLNDPWTFSYPPPKIADGTLDAGDGPSSSFTADNNLGGLITFRGFGFRQSDADFKIFLGNDINRRMLVCGLPPIGTYFDDTLIQCRLPAGGTGTGLTFQVVALNLVANGTDEYNYPVGLPMVYNVSGCTTIGLSATNCPTVGGVELTIFGANLKAPITVFIGSSISAINTIDYDQGIVTCQLPAGAGSQLAVKLSSNGQLTNDVYLVSYAFPTVTTLTSDSCTSEQPNRLINCPRNGSAIITVEGANFGGVDAPRVLIGGDTCQYISGTYADDHTSVQCTLPPNNREDRPVLVLAAAGDLSDGSATVSYTQCIPGTYEGSGTTSLQCIDCSAGTFSNQYGSTSCTNCTSGTISLARSATCSPCNVGTAANAERSATSCIPCSVAKYAPMMGSTKCLICPVGTASDRIGAGQCDQCLPGFVQSQPGQTYCDSCSAGSFNPLTGQPSADCGLAVCGCGPCESGYFSGNGSRVCASCLAGSYSGTGSSSCTLCIMGTYQSS
jgi:hypothetical protein